MAVLHCLMDYLLKQLSKTVFKTVLVSSFESQGEKQRRSSFSAFHTSDPQLKNIIQVNSILNIYIYYINRYINRYVIYK